MSTLAEDKVTSDTTSPTVQSNASTIDDQGQGRSTLAGRSLGDLVPVGMTINMYGSLVVLVLGLVGNVLTLVLMRTCSLKKTTSSIYFSNLAAADLFHLLDYFTGRWLAIHAGWNVWQAWGDFACKMKRVSYLFGLNWPAWIVVAMTAERVVAILYPLKAKVWLTRRNAHAACISIGFFFFVLWTVLILMWGVSGGPCDLREVLAFLRDYGYPLGTTLYTYVPTPILIVMNGVLIYQLLQARAIQKTMTRSATFRDQPASKGLTRVTVMSVVVSVTYMILTLPSMIIAYLDSMKDTSHYETMMVKFLREIFFVLRDLNHAINFFLYLWILPKVRHELLNMWRATSAAVCLSAKGQEKSESDGSSRPTTSTKITEMESSTL